MERRVEWWERQVTLHLLDRPTVIGNLPDNITQIYDSARTHLFSALNSLFHTRVCDLKERDRVHFPVILHPVYLSLSGDVFAALQNSDSEQGFRDLCRARLPESETPFIFQHGSVTDTRGLNPSFFNVVFLQSSAFPLMQFSHDQRIWLFQSLLAKLGSFKNLIVLCDESGIDRVYLSSLEGGHPSFTLDQFHELARRLHVFGSAQPAQTDFAFSDLTIPSDIWANSAGVRDLRALGEFAGEHDLLSPPVRIADLVHSDSLRRLIERLARYSQQAEGAMLVVDPGLSNALNTRNPIALVTASGQFGVVKTDLGPGDIIAVEIDIASGCLRRLHVGASDERKPSVEAMEFLVPFVDLCRSHDLFVAALPDGQGFMQVDSSNPFAVQVPPIRGIFHLHRRVDVCDPGLLVQQNILQNPPVGCGVDLMEEISRRGFECVVHDWFHHNRGIPRRILEVANHGVHVVELWACNRGVYHAACFADFCQAVSDGRLVFDRAIQQR